VPGSRAAGLAMAYKLIEAAPMARRYTDCAVGALPTSTDTLTTEARRYTLRRCVPFLSVR
jgi:hypothetical protein